MKSSCIYCFTFFITCSSLAFVKDSEAKKRSDETEDGRRLHLQNIFKTNHLNNRLREWLRQWQQHHKNSGSHEQIHVPQWQPVNHPIKFPVNYHPANHPVKYPVNYHPVYHPVKYHGNHPNSYHPGNRPPKYPVNYQPVNHPLKYPVHHPVKYPVDRPATPRPSKEREGPLNFPDFISRWQGEVERCGQPEVQPRLKELRIVGGSTAERGSWPWMASLQYKPFKQHWCGGQLISNQWILTAAHCLYAVPFPKRDIASRWAVRLGRYNVSASSEPTEQTYNISKLYVHSGFKLEQMIVPQAHPVPSDNDLALIKLDRPVQLNKWVSPICMPTSDMQPTNNERCVVAGWGATAKVDQKFKFPDLLQEAVVPVYNSNRCKMFPGYRPLITQNMVCAGYNSGKVDTCTADSGGPLQCKHGERWYVIGTTSWGDAGENGCAEAMKPGVYTKVSNYLEWIQTTVYEEYIMGFDVESQ